MARIVAVFASVDKLQAKYGIVVKESSAVVAGGGARKARFRDRLAASIRVRLRSKSSGPSTSTAQTSISGATNDDLYLLENLQVLESKDIVPGLDDEITSMTQAMDRVQQCLPMYLKLRWVISDNAKLEELLRKLTNLNKGLFGVLPISESSLVLAQANTPQSSQLKLSFEIPFQPNIQKSSEFVEREYLLEILQQEVEGGKHTLNIIVLYGTGGIGKTQLALEYIQQHHKDYSSVFWINVASNQTAILGFTQIMQRLIKHHAKLSDDYSQIGRLLGMAGKLDANGCFSVTQPSEAQHVLDAVKEWFALPDNTNWLLVFDNLDDPDSVDIGEYIPACNYGTVIITSRWRDLQQGRRGFEVHQMQPMEAIQLLLTACAMPKFEELGPSGKWNIHILSVVRFLITHYMTSHPECLRNSFLSVSKLTIHIQSKPLPVLLHGSSGTCHLPWIKLEHTSIWLNIYYLDTKQHTKPMRVIFSAKGGREESKIDWCLPHGRYHSMQSSKRVQRQQSYY